MFGMCFFGDRLYYLQACNEEIRPMTNNRAIHITYVLVTGGHTYEALKVAERLNSTYVNSYILYKDDEITPQKIKDNGKIAKITRSFQEIRRKSILQNAVGCIKFTYSILESVRALRELNTHVVISTGSGPALAPMIAAKLLGKKVIFVESACRINSYSLCGWFAYKFLADLFFVQWPDTKKVYPKAIYAGRLF